MVRQGNIKVVKPSSDFEQVSGKVIRTFDAETIGVYCKLLAFGESWTLSIKGLSSVLGLSKERVRKAINELESEGYILRKAIQMNDGKMEGWDYIVLGNCIDEEHRSDAGGWKNRHDGKPTYRKTDMTEISDDNNNILESNNILKEYTYDICVNKGEVPSRRFVKPSLDEVRAYCNERNNSVDPEAFVDFYESKGWMVGKTPMKDWKASVRTWEKSRKQTGRTGGTSAAKKTTMQRSMEALDRLLGEGYSERTYGVKWGGNDNG